MRASSVTVRFAGPSATPVIVTDCPENIGSAEVRIVSSGVLRLGDVIAERFRRGFDVGASGMRDDTDARLHPES